MFSDMTEPVKYTFDRNLSTSDQIHLVSYQNDAARLLKAHPNIKQTVYSISERILVFNAEHYHVCFYITGLTEILLNTS